jgi:O-acetyl-ADP-ribose deacetylase (regulator of RNase III)
LKVVRVDLVKLALDGRFEVIIHGCNCQCVVGAGIAKAIKQTFPEAYNADKATAKGSRTKLGSLSSVSDAHSGSSHILLDNSVSGPTGANCSPQRLNMGSPK